MTALQDILLKKGGEKAVTQNKIDVLDIICTSRFNIYY